jgi:hypothetical protein
MEIPYKLLMHKLSSVCFIMRRLSPILNMQTLRAVYFAHFYSLVNYGIIFWGNTSSAYKVFRIKKRKEVRIMLGISSRSYCREWFNKFEILPIPSLYIYIYTRARAHARNAVSC